MPRQTDPKNLERVLDEAAALFLVEGYDSATMQQLADRLGLHKSSLYHYVDGKEDLLNLLTSAAQERAEEDLDTAEKAGQEGWLEAISLAVDQTVSDQGRTSLVLRQKPGTLTGDTVVERRRAYDRRLAKLIEQSQHSGDLRDDIHPILMARLIMGMVAWLIEWYDPELSRFTPEEIRDAVVGLVTNGARNSDDN